MDDTKKLNPGWFRLSTNEEEEKMIEPIHKSQEERTIDAEQMSIGLEILQKA